MTPLFAAVLNRQPERWQAPPWSGRRSNGRRRAMPGTHGLAPRVWSAKLAPLYGLALQCLALWGCGTEVPKQVRMPLSISVQNVDGQPVPGATLWAGGRALGATDDRGQLKAHVAARAGDNVTLRRTCPRGYASEDEERRLRVALLLDKAGHMQPLRAQFECRSTEVDTALVVRAVAPDGLPIPIHVDGKQIGQTNSQGLAHLQLRVPAESTVHVALDTSHYPKLLPRNPVRTFELSHQSEVLLFDQPFERVRAARRQKRRPTVIPRAAAPRRIR